MKAIVCTKFESPQDLQFEEVENQKIPGHESAGETIDI
jgi:hypothetical protein